ncbi:NAD+ synthase (glutamine-hydrolysing) [Spirosomataceae bacterium TFI 002]|nr:NAD+ synthase (glutamine-hydrolysing) [Spirosomataceae bacterium TFI 002]
MRIVKVASGALNQTPLDWKNNKANILQCIEDARAKGVSILCLPELCITSYGCEDSFYSPYVCELALEILQEIKNHTKDMVVCIGLPLSFQNKIYNTACIIADRNILGFTCKQHLPNYGVFYEDRWFHRWPAGIQNETIIEGFKCPIGDITYQIGDIHLGVEICEDAWVPNRPAIRQFDKGVDIILNPSASPFEFHKFQTREKIVEDSSRSYCCTYVYTNLLGNESGRLIFDGDAMIASGGNLLASSHRFSYKSFTLTTATVDLDIATIAQAKIKSPIDGKSIVKFDFNFPEGLKPDYSVAELEPFEIGGFLKEEEFARAISLALFDYLRKSYSQGFTISLSGGADSSACTALVGLMIKLAEESIGLDGFKEKLGHIKKIQNLKSKEEIGHQIIHTMYQSTKNSGDATNTAAKKLAESIGATFYDVSINGIVEQYTSLIESQIDKKLTWEENDIALQNIQARVRAPGIWLLTNLTGHLLLATSNRSEVAVGYCTMDGDTAGSISPIAGIDKHWLRSWLIWLEKTGCNVSGKHIKIEGLQYVNKLSPTAELRPQDQNQTDEKDLMPYEILNEIELTAIKQKKSPVETFKYMLVKFDQRYSREDIYSWVKRFFKLWSRNQWKRERYAPSFHVDGHNLDPRSYCRFPILSGSFELELDELDEFVKNGNRKKSKKIGF